MVFDPFRGTSFREASKRNVALLCEPGPVLGGTREITNSLLTRKRSSLRPAFPKPLSVGFTLHFPVGVTHEELAPVHRSSFQSLLINEMGPPVLLPALFAVLDAERLFFAVTDGFDTIGSHSSRY
jgi:hypothetical protein